MRSKGRAWRPAVRHFVRAGGFVRAPPRGDCAAQQALFQWPWVESNHRTQLRRLPLCPLSYRAPTKRGVAEGIRTHDHRDHNPGLYQLSYRHREQSQSSRVQPVTLHTGREAEADLRDRPRADQ